MRLLLVMHDAAASYVCADYFTIRGCDVDTANDVETTEILLRENDYDVVIIDADASDFAHRVMGLARSQNREIVPILLTTGNVANPMARTFTKPLPLQEILDSVRQQIC